MKIEKHFIQDEYTSLEVFADQYGLIMVVSERHAPTERHMRYYARFKDSEIKDGGILISESGNGSTPEEAMSDYAAIISGKTIVVKAMRPERREIRVPLLSHSQKTRKPSREEISMNAVIGTAFELKYSLKPYDHSKFTGSDGLFHGLSKVIVAKNQCEAIETLHRFHCDGCPVNIIAEKLGCCIKWPKE